MRRPLILLALAPLLMAQARTGPGIPRQSCGFGEALAQLRSAERETRRPVGGVLEGRARGEGLFSSLSSAASTFRGCDCTRLAELTAEAASVAASAPSEASVARLTEIFGRVRYRVQMAREFSDAQACR